MKEIVEKKRRINLTVPVLRVLDCAVSRSLLDTDGVAVISEAEVLNKV